jgi:hypothetical protein
MGRKRIFQMLSLDAPGFWFLAAVFALVAEALEGAAPRLFRPMYAGANMGHPSRKEGFVLCSNRSAADELHLGCDHDLISHLRAAGSVPATKSIQQRLPIN